MALTTNLISYYKLDESSGDAIDAHGSNDGTVTGATQNVAGKINTAYSFDGAGQDRVSTFTTPANGTISLWVKFDVLSEIGRASCRERV